MPRIMPLLVLAASCPLVGCGAASTRDGQAVANVATPATAPAAEGSAAPSPQSVIVASPAQAEDRVETVERVTSDGTLVQTRELVGPDVLPADARPLRSDEIEEIEQATGRPYQEGDTIHGRAEQAPDR